MRTAVLRILACSVIWQALVLVAATACDCGLPRQKETAAATILSRSPIVVYGTVTSMSHMDAAGAGDPLVRARISIAKIVKGSAPRDITVVTVGGDNGANCGFAGNLKLAMQERRMISLAPRQIPSDVMTTPERLAFASEAYWVDLCTSGWDFESVARDRN